MRTKRSVSDEWVKIERPEDRAVWRVTLGGASVAAELTGALRALFDEAAHAPKLKAVLLEGQGPPRRPARLGAEPTALERLAAFLERRSPAWRNA